MNSKLLVTYFPLIRTTKLGSVTMDGLLRNVSNETRFALNTSSVINDCLLILPQRESWASPRRQLERKKENK